MGSTPNFPERPNENDSQFAWNKYWFQFAVRHLQIMESLSNSDFAEVIEKKPEAIAHWFFRGEKGRIPNLSDVQNIFEATENMTPTGVHGRAFNYVLLFEKEPLTRFEQSLVATVDKLTKEKNRYKKEAQALRAIIDGEE